MVFGITTKQDGQMKLYGDGRDEGALNNRKKYFEKVGLDVNKSIAVNLVHGINVVKVGLSDAGRIVQDADALITDDPNVILTITVADCVPIYFFDPVNKAIGIAHAGWRGVVGNIALNVVKAMQDSYGSSPADFLVEIGLHIQDCHFEVLDDVASKFTEFPESVIKKDGKMFIDLQSVIKNQLMSISVKLENIKLSKECTYCLPDKYFSYRRDKPDILQAMMAYITIK